MASTTRLTNIRQESTQRRSNVDLAVASEKLSNQTGKLMLKTGPTFGQAPRPVSPPANKSNPCTPFISNLGTEMVDMYVGPEEKLFRVHKKKICKVPYFEKLFNSGFREADERVARLPEDNYDAFDVLMEWIYLPTLPRFHPTNTKLAPKSAVANDSSWLLLEVFALAEKYCIPKLQDLTMDIIRREHKAQKKLPSTQYVQQAYEKTITGSALSRYSVSAMYYTIDCSYSESDWSTSEVEKLFQVLPHFASDYIRLQRSTSPMDPREGYNCHYHSHRVGENCHLSTSKTQIIPKDKTSL